MAQFENHIPMDRRQAMARGETLPEHQTGAALFADISSFGKHTEDLANELGPNRGAQEITRLLNQIYIGLVSSVDDYRGSIIGFGGDAIICWFEGDNGQHALRASLDMQEMMQSRFAQVSIPALHRSLTLTMKAAVVTGSVRRFVIGDPNLQLLDVMVGSTLDRLATAEKMAESGKSEVVVEATVLARLDYKFKRIQQRQHPTTGELFSVITEAQPGFMVSTPPAWPTLKAGSLAPEQIRPWLLKPVYQRLQENQAGFVAEIRPAVSLFVRFSGLDYDYDPDVHAKLDLYIRWVQRVLERYGGCLIQLTFGDKGSYLYSSFGTPRAHGDDAARALAAALELRRPPPELGYISETQIGLSQGRAWSGVYGGSTRFTYGVLGVGVNRAARLMSEAQPEQILVSQDLTTLTGGHYRFQSAPAVQVKDREEPVLVSWLLDWQASSFTMFTNPLVGRAVELADWQHYLEAVARGVGQIARLEGERGVGKSHLMSHLAQSALAAGWRVALGRCQFTALSPWRQIFRSLFGLMGSASDDGVIVGVQSLAELEAQLQQLNLDWRDRLPLVGDLLGLSIPETAASAAFAEHRQEILNAFAIELLQAYAQTRPLLLIVEDSLWLDEVSLTLVLTLQRVIGDSRIGLIFVHRPLAQGDNSLLVKLIEHVPSQPERILHELSPEAVRQVITEQLRYPPAPLLLSLILAQTRGNPLFIRELIRDLHDTGRLFLNANLIWGLSEGLLRSLAEANCLTSLDGEWVLRDDAHLEKAHLEIPDSIQSVVLTPVARLSESLAPTLRLACVIGRTFEIEVLARALTEVRTREQRPSLSPEELASHLEALEIAGLIQPRQPNENPRAKFIFTQHVVQEALYSTLLDVQRREYHLAVGKALEALALARPEMMDQVVESLADHYTHSFSQEFPNAEARERMLTYLDKAARQAQQRFFNETALRYLARALQEEKRWVWRLAQVDSWHILGRRADEQAALQALQQMPGIPGFELNYRLGVYHLAISEFKLAVQDFHQALGQPIRPSTVNRAHCLAQLGLAYWEQGRNELAIEQYQKAISLFPEPMAASADAKRALIQAHNGLGSVYRQLRRFAEARQHYEQALELSRAIQDYLGEARTFSNLGVAAYHQHHFAEAITYHQLALDLRRHLGYWEGEGFSLGNLALVARDSGHYSQAIEYFLAARAICQATGNRSGEVNVWSDLGILHLELGHVAEAQRCLRRGLRLARASGDIVGQAYVLSNLGLVLLDKEKFESADYVLRQGLGLMQGLADSHQQAVFLTYLSNVSLRRRNMTEAVERARAALTLRQALKLKELQADNLALIAVALQIMGELPQALEHARQAQTILDACQGQGPEFPQADYFCCFRVWSATGQTQLAREALCRAYALVMERAQKIHDVDLRQSFLGRVAVNREILRLANDWGCADPLLHTPDD